MLRLVPLLALGPASAESPLEAKARLFEPRLAGLRKMVGPHGPLRNETLYSWSSSLVHELTSHDEKELQAAFDDAKNFVAEVKAQMQRAPESGSALEERLAKLQQSVRQLVPQLPKDDPLRKSGEAFDHDVTVAFSGPHNHTTLQNLFHRAADWVKVRMARAKKDHKHFEDDQTDLLLRMLYQRRRLGIESQIAVLDRDLFKDSPYVPRLKAVHNETRPLVEDMKDLMKQDGKEIPELKTKQVRPTVVTSRQRNLRDHSITYMEGAYKKLGCPDPKLEICQHIAASVEEVKHADVATSAKIMADMPKRIEKWLKAEVAKQSLRGKK